MSHSSSATGARLARALLSPASIALIGASADEQKHSSLPQRYLRKHGFRGAIFPINPARHEIFGERAYASIDQVPQPVDHAFIMLPARLVPDAVEQCAVSGVTCTSIFSAGFAEAGNDGREFQKRIVDTARRTGMRILGPNCLGIINSNQKIALSANEVLEIPQLLEGRISLVSQSGSLLGALLSRAQSRGFRFAKMISVGNEADLGVGEIGELLVDDPQTDAILLFLETIRDPHTFSRMARRAFAAKKPVIAYLLGRSAVGSELAASHTGAIAGNTAAIEAFLRQHGVLRVDMLETLFEMPPLVMKREPPKRQRVNVMTTTGGGGALLVDNLGLRGIVTAGPDAAVVQSLAARDIHIGTSPLIDLTIGGANARVFGAVLDALIKSPENDAIVAVVGSSSQYRPDRAVMPIVELAAGSTKPVAAFLTPVADESARLLNDASVAAFRTPEACADAIRAYFAWQAPDPEIKWDVPRDAKLLEVAQGHGTASADDAVAVLDALAIARPKTALLPIDPSNGEIEAAAAGLEFPVAIKIESPDILHRTEAGGVMLDIADLAALRAGLCQMRDIVRRRQPDARLRGFSIQEMRRGVAEVLVGYRVDPQIGPTITTGVGGVLAEIYRDVAVALAPVTVDGALAMIQRVRGFAPLLGYRNLPKGDIAALARAISAWSTLALVPGSHIREAELNPLIVGAEGQGVVAVDALSIRQERNAT